MSHHEPKISVIIPVFNGERHITATLESVFEQSLKPLEVIVINDGSTDGSGDKVRRFEPNVNYIHQPHQGVGAARNKGVAHARGDFFAFVDADDLWPPNSLRARYQVFAEHPEVEVVFGFAQNFLSEEVICRQEELSATPLDPMPGYQVGSMLVRGESYLKVGAFRTDLRVGEGIDWFARAREQSLIERMIPDLVLRRRIHGNNLGVREHQSWSDYARVIKSALDRRRMQTGKR